jgi:anthranilate phosphoribosyltransferase
VGFRTLVVKRPSITTVEVLSGPVRGRKRTHLVTGYVHKPYPRIYAMLARHSGFDSALLVRGIEGGIIPSLRQTGRLFYYHDKGEEQSVDVEPSNLGIQQENRAVAVPDTVPSSGKEGDDIQVSYDTAALAHAAAEAGVAALSGDSGATRDALVYGSANILWHLKLYDTIPEAADAVRAMIDSGKPLEHFNNA